MYILEVNFHDTWKVDVFCCYWWCVFVAFIYVSLMNLTVQYSQDRHAVFTCPDMELCYIEFNRFNLDKNGPR